LGEASNQFFRGTARDWPARMHQVAPGGNAGAAPRHAFKSDPLREGGAHGVVNPANALSGNTAGDYVLDSRIEWAKNLNFQAAARLPWQALSPINRAVNAGEGVPAAAVREDIPT